MKFFILLEYAVNLILLSYFHIHIFQLNSYSYQFHTHWLNTNKRKILLQLFLVLLPLLLLLFNHIATQIVASLILAISIWYNFPKKKAKIGFHFTKRVMRMFITQVILFAIFLLVGGTKNLVITLAILNSIMFFIYLVINFINSPIEKLIK